MLLYDKRARMLLNMTVVVKGSFTSIQWGTWGCYILTADFDKEIISCPLLNRPKRATSASSDSSFPQSCSIECQVIEELGRKLGFEHRTVVDARWPSASVLDTRL